MKLFRKRKREFDELQLWVLEQFESKDAIDLKEARTKYKELFGVKKRKTWEKYNKRTRLRLYLKTVACEDNVYKWEKIE